MGKCLPVGGRDGEELSEPELGTTQGSVLSPLLGNVYGHYVLDRGFETEGKPRLQGRATLMGFGDASLSALNGRTMPGGCRRGSANGWGASDGPSTRTRRGGCHAGIRPRHNRTGTVRRPSTFWGALLLDAHPPRSLADVGQDTAGEFQTGEDVHRRLVPPPSASVDRGAARRA